MKPIRYEINGHIFEFETEPTEQDIDEIASQNPKTEKSSDDKKSNITGVEKQNVFGKTFNVPAAGIRSFLQGKGYVAGITNPSKVRSFQDLAIESVQKSPDPVINALVGMPASTLGLIADTVTNPAEVLEW